MFPSRMYTVNVKNKTKLEIKKKRNNDSKRENHERQQNKHERQQNKMGIKNR